MRQAIPFLCALALASCAPESATAPDRRPMNARADALWDGQEWLAEASAELLPGDSLPRLVITAFRSYGRVPVGEWLFLAVPFAGPGEYGLDESDVWVDIVVSEDEKFGGFQGSRPVPGSLRIDEVDPVHKLVRGSAEFSLVGSRDEITADTVHVRIVRFVAPLTGLE